jgi:hypothetical protein
MIVTALIIRKTAEKMYMSAINLNIRAGYYGIIMCMVIVLRGIPGHVVCMTSKIRVFGGSSRELMEVSGCLAGFVVVTVSMQFVVHVMHLLLSVYAGRVFLDIGY